jgi:hypothetical protein
LNLTYFYQIFIVRQCGVMGGTGRLVATLARMVTSCWLLDWVLDPGNLSIQIDTLIKAAGAVGRTVEIRLKPQAKQVHSSAA